MDRFGQFLDLLRRGWCYYAVDGGGVAFWDGVDAVGENGDVEVTATDEEGDEDDDEEEEKSTADCRWGCGKCHSDRGVDCFQVRECGVAGWCC